MNGLDLLIPYNGDRDSSTWATVTQASPLRVKLDGDSAALPFAPDTLVANLVVNDRVWVTLSGRRVVILGRAGGQGSALLDTLSSAWTSYTPVWTATTTNPAIGNGTITGAYIQTGKLVSMRAVITAGSTTTFGSGVWLVSLPVTPKADSVLTAVAYDSSASTRYRATVHIYTAAASGDNMRWAANDTGGSVNPTSPFTWASGDKLILGGTYEAA